MCVTINNYSLVTDGLSGNIMFNDVAVASFEYCDMVFYDVAPKHLNAIRKMFSEDGIASLGNFSLELLVKLLLKAERLVKQSLDIENVALVVTEYSHSADRNLTFVPVTNSCTYEAIQGSLTQGQYIHEVKPTNDMSFTL